MDGRTDNCKISTVESPIMTLPPAPAMAPTEFIIVLIYYSDFEPPTRGQPPIKDKSHAPKVSFIRRLHCIVIQALTSESHDLSVTASLLRAE